MPCIRRTYHGSAVYMDPNICGGRSPLCGQTVPVIDGDDWNNEPFWGWIGIEDITEQNCVIVTGIAAFNPGHRFNDPWIEYHKDDWFLGHRDGRGDVYLVVKDNRLIKLGARTLDIQPPQREGNVAKLFRNAG